jgi:hypothetical protein
VGGRGLFDWSPINHGQNPVYTADTDQSLKWALSISSHYLKLWCFVTLTKDSQIIIEDFQLYACPC